MSSTAEHQTDAPPDYLNDGYGLRSWLLTTDHKRIAMLYLMSVTIFFMMGSFFAALIRAELVTPEGDLVTPDMYNRLFTMHGVIMVFLFLIPTIPAVFGNFFVPIMIGAKDLAMPRLNLASWYVFNVGAVLILYSIFAGGLDTGWTFYVPYSSSYSATNVVTAAVGIFIAGFASIMTGLNLMVTIHRMRAPGMTWFRLPLFVWANYATSIIILLGTPVVAITILMVGAERMFQLGIFDPAYGGDPILFQHLFWFYSHPAVYIMVLPAMGIQSELMAAFARKRIFGYRYVVYSSLGIAVLGFLVWGHHMYTSGQSAYAAAVFSILTMLVAVPSAVKTFNWTATLYRGSISFQTPMLYALAFMGLFLVGGLTGVMLGTLGIDVHVHDTYFVVAHFHYVMVGVTVSAFMGGLHYWWPKMTGRLYPSFPSKISAILVFLGFNLTFFPQFLLGFMGMPRRYHAYPVEDWQVLNVLSSAGATVLGVGFLLPAVYLTWSLFRGKRAPANPWGAVGLEWDIPSPPTKHNFEEDVVVTHEAYDYDARRDAIAAAAAAKQEADLV
ncbi:cytochrome c oxidase subunit I [bacterium]|nr:MAG: cytochrome c oxidase subunit I [bacterium]